MSNKFIFNPLTVDENAIMIANHMPLGRLWSQKINPNSNLGLLIRGLAYEFYRIDLKIQEVSKEIDVNQTIALIEQWERSVGIPSSCIQNPNDFTLQYRRDLVLFKLTNFGGIQTSEDFINLASIFGYDIEVISGVDISVFPLKFPIVFSPNRRTSSHTIYIRFLSGGVTGNTFPLPFPIPFTTGGEVFLKCILEQLAPANTQIKFIN